MKKYLLFLGLCAGTLMSAQIKVGDNHETIDPSAVLELESTDKGFLPPRLTTEQRDAIENPVKGLLIYNITTKCLNYHTGTEWFTSCIPPFSFVLIDLIPEGLLVHGIDVSDPNEADVVPSQVVDLVVMYPGPYDYSATVNGITFSASGEFTTTGRHQVVLEASGTPEDIGTHTFVFDDFSFDRTTFVPDRRYADVTTQGSEEGRHHRFLYDTYTSPTGKVWLQTNLGSHYNKVGHAVFNPGVIPTSGQDFHAYGSFFQWGRYSDGHELINWTETDAGTPVNGVTTTLSATEDPGHPDYIIATNWIYPSNNNLWQGNNGTNNPCPSGYHVPTNAEIEAELAQHGITNSDTAFASDLKITSTGYRNQANGNLTSIGGTTRLWSQEASATNENQASHLSIYVYYDWMTDTIVSFSGIESNNKGQGMALRCVKNN